MGPRIAPGGLRELGFINWLICRVLSRATGVRDAQLFSTLGKHRRLFRAWLKFSAQLMPGGTISKHETELAILRVAQLRGCRYEQEHHARIGRRVGIDAELLARIGQGPGAQGWTARHRALLRAVDSLVHSKNIDDATWTELCAHYDERQRIELCMLVGQYEGLATTIATLRIASDF